GERVARADKALHHRIAASTAREGAAPPAPEPAAAGHAPPEEEVVEFDPEVAAIFTDEATELIAQSERALADWRSEPGSAEFRLALKRPLHTLKGGARMAGITPMGDLSHELETLVMAVDNGTIGAEPAVFDLIQASLDELARMREQVVNGRPVTPPRAMIASLQDLSRSDGATPAESPPVPPPDAAPERGAVAAAAPAPAAAALIRPRTAEPHAEEGLLPPQPVPPGREPGAGGERQEMARVDAELLDQLLNISGEASIARARLEQQLGSFDFNLGELSRTVTRLKEQLRSLEIETEAQILHKHDDEGPQHR